VVRSTFMRVKRGRELGPRIKDHGPRIIKNEVLLDFLRV